MDWTRILRSFQICDLTPVLSYNRHKTLIISISKLHCLTWSLQFMINLKFVFIFHALKTQFPLIRIKFHETSKSGGSYLYVVSKQPVFFLISITFLIFRIKSILPFKDRSQIRSFVYLLRLFLECF